MQVGHTLAYLFNCWICVVVNILESVLGDYPYRYGRTNGVDMYRPMPYEDYVNYRNVR